MDFTHARDNATERKRTQDSAIDVGIYRRIYKHGRSNHDLKDAYRRVHPYFPRGRVQWTSPFISHNPELAMMDL